MSTQTDESKTIVFIGAENSARSQMAEGLARGLVPPDWRVFSAGPDPSIVHPLAIEALREIDIDISGSQAKHFDAVPVDEADIVITLCEEQVAPGIPPGAEHLDWAMPSPVGRGDQIRFQLDAFRETRDEIKERLESFFEDRTD